MRVHAIQHVPFEGLAGVRSWAEARGHTVAVTLASSDVFPSSADYDMLVIMGGPMNIYEIDLYPWLAQERRAVEEAIARGKGVLGICLGAQMVADVLGGSVRRNDAPEIGWFPVELTGAGTTSRVFGALPVRFVAGHWHWDMFEIPPGAVLTAFSDACVNQAFEYDDGRVIGVQFHLEWTPEALALLFENAGEGTPSGTWVQSEGEMLGPDAPYVGTAALLAALLDSLESRVTGSQGGMMV